MSTQNLLEHNIATLNQALNILDHVTRRRLAYGTEVGPHLRHVLEHYEGFVTGLAAGRIDYDARPRDRAVETRIEVARQRIVDLIARLGELADDGPLPSHIQVRLASASDAPGLEAWSSPDRELQFLQSHAVHHFALIRLHLQACGEAPGDDFGKAPSTLRFEQVSA